MTDAELIARLQNSKGWPTLGNAAADRIEQLVATNEALIEKSARRLVLARDEGVARVEQFERAEAAEAKLAKAVELLREIEEHLERISGFFFDTFPRKEIKATLAEIKGESHE